MLEVLAPFAKKGGEPLRFEFLGDDLGFFGCRYCLPQRNSIFEQSFVAQRAFQPKQRDTEFRVELKSPLGLRNRVIVVARPVIRTGEVGLEDERKRIEFAGAFLFADGLVVATQDGQVTGMPITAEGIIRVECEAELKFLFGAGPIPVVPGTVSTGELGTCCPTTRCRLPILEISLE
jgi:hypothetical protein